MIESQKCGGRMKVVAWLTLFQFSEESFPVLKVSRESFLSHFACVRKRILKLLRV